MTPPTTLPRTHARIAQRLFHAAVRLASSPSPRDSRRRQPTVAAAAHARLAQSYAVCSPLMASRHAPPHSCDANMRLGPVTARRRRQAVTRRQTHPLRSRPRGMSVCHEKRHRVRACAWCLDAQRLRVFAADNRQTHAVEARREMPRPARPARPPLSNRLERIRGTAKGQRRLIDLKSGEIRSVKLEIIYNQDKVTGY